MVSEAEAAIFTFTCVYFSSTFLHRSDTILAGPSSMAFVRGTGEHSVTTRDLSVSDITIIQFDVSITF